MEQEPAVGELAEQPSPVEVCLDRAAVNAAPGIPAVNGLKRADDHQHDD